MITLPNQIKTIYGVSLSTLAHETAAKMNNRYQWGGWAFAEMDTVEADKIATFHYKFTHSTERSIVISVNFRNSKEFGGGIIQFIGAIELRRNKPLSYVKDFMWVFLKDAYGQVKKQRVK